MPFAFFSLYKACSPTSNIAFFMRCAIVARTFPMHVLQQLRNLFPGVPVGTTPSRVNSTQVRRRVGDAQTRCAILTCDAAFSLFSSPAVCVLLPIVYSLKRLICSCTRTLFRFDAT